MVKRPECGNTKVQQYLAFIIQKALKDYNAELSQYDLRFQPVTVMLLEMSCTW